MKVFITGGSGWVGSATVPRLVAAGHEVTALARSDAAADALTAAGAAPVRGSLDDVGTLRDAAAAADGVIHLAFKHEQLFSGDAATALAADQRTIQAFGEVLAGSDRPLVIASGMAGQPSDRVITEDDRPDVSGGGLSGRMQSEAELLALAGAGVRAVSVRLAPTVHGHGDPGFVAMFARVARETGVSGYVAEGANRWPAAHRDDIGELFRLAVESAPAGSVVHGAAEEGVPVREIAEALGRRLSVPARSVEPDHFGWLGVFAAVDVRASSARTRETLGWAPTGPLLLADIEAGGYDGA